MEKTTELAKFYFADILNNLEYAKKEEKLLIMEQIRRSGINHDLLKEIMIDYKSLSGVTMADLTPILKAYKESLVKPGIFYYHPHLQLSNGPPKITQLDNGDFVEVLEPFFLRNLRVFTPEHMGDYFHYKMGTKSLVKARDVQSIKHLLKVCDDNLDLAMYTIDLGTAITIEKGERPLVSAVYLTDYIYEADFMLKDRMANCMAEGLDHECR